MKKTAIILLILLFALPAFAFPPSPPGPPISVSSGKTPSFLNSITISGTDGSTLNVGSGGTLFSTNTSLGTSDAIIPTQAAIKSYVDAGLLGKAASNAATTVNGVSCALGGSCTIAAGSLKGYASFPAGALIPDTCSGLLQNDSDPNIFDYLAFDGATDEFALFVWIPPDDYDAGTIKAKFSWAASAAMTDAHTVIFELNCYAVGDGGTLDVAFNSGAQTASDAYATGDETGPKLKISAATPAITIQGTPAAGKPVFCRVSRDADTDTSTVDAWLVNVAIEYGKTGATPAAW